MKRWMAAAARIVALTLLLAAIAGCTMGDLPMRKGIEELSTADPVWKFSQKLTATTDLVADARFGYAVSISENYAIIGAYQDSSGAGAAYIFKRSGTSWSKLKKITPTAPVAGSYFGCSVSIDGDYAIVGALSADTAYIFSKDTGSTDNWGEVKMLPGTLSSYFGCSVEIKGLHAIIGAFGDSSGKGKASIYFRDQEGANNWGWVADVQDSTGSDGDNLGYSVAISDNYAAAGAPNSANGFVMVYQKISDTSWGNALKVEASDGAASDQFGQCVALTDTDLVAGAAVKQYAYAFSRTGSSWGEVDKLFLASTQPTDNFGSSVSLHGDYLAIGADGQDSNKGALHAYDKKSGSWKAGLNSPLYEQVRTDDNHFGFSSAIHDTCMIVGAYGDSSTAESAGAAYIYMLGDY